jgi:hypothetical protein
LGVGGVTDRVHRAVMPVKRAALHAPADPVPAEAEPRELVRRHQSVLSARQFGEGSVEFVTCQVT